MNYRLIAALPLILCLSLLSSCYVIDIQQGNKINPVQVAKLKVGMSKEQVQYVMGSTVLQNAFAEDHWDYVYTLRDSKRRLTYQHVGMTFKNNQLVAIEQ